MLGLGLGRLLAHPAAAGLRRRLRHAVVRAGERAAGRGRLHGRLEDDCWYSLAVPGIAGSYVLARGPVGIGGWALDLASGSPLPVRARIGRRIVAAEPMERADVRQAFCARADVPLLCGFGIDLDPGRLPGLLAIEAETRPGRWRQLYRCVLLPFGGDRSGGGVAWRYRDWCLREDEAAAADAAGQRDYAALWAGRPSVSVILEAPAGAASPEAAALAAQTYPPCETLVLGTGGPADLAAAFRAARGDFCLVLATGDRLRPDALYTLAAAAQAEPDLELIYADEDCDGEGTDPAPFFKPAWSPDTLESFDYLGAPVLYSTSALHGLAPADTYDLALRFTETIRRVRHLPRVLCRRSRSPTAPRDTAAQERALAGRIARTGVTHAAVHAVAAGIPCLRPEPELGRSGPLVSIVVPTAGRELRVGGRTLDLAADCVRGIRERSTYRNVEVILVVNLDMPAAKRAALHDLGARTVLYEEPAFNVATKLNLGAAEARGEMLLLLNDDTEIITPGWIERLLLHAVKPHVGAVGAKLLYADGSVQHAGVVTVRGNPNHVRRFLPDEDLGYVFGAAAPRNWGAVTGAVMMTRTADYRAVGGYSEEFPVHFNDVDYCFKLRRRGLHVVLEPGAKLYHYESASRAPSIHPEELALFQARWGGELLADPFYPAHAFGTVPPAHEIHMRAGHELP